MKQYYKLAFVLFIALLFNCRKDKDEYDWPVWILDVYAFEEGESGINQAVHGCPWVRWRFEDNNSWNLNHCTEGNRVKVWKHIDNTVTLLFTVGCDGYSTSAEFSVTFPMQDVRQNPGRDGPEVERRYDVILWEN